ncbi:ESX secretion-associated protein EspG [Amycolatopsis aidingensis]|uniref:ESX secretion-associated protein EspG n=1 Tax=Amycolatopsis aidingensis TaxID=2842453 RepID=UPI001C0AEBDB|nr:ESX secretion-associated protein EspG [Amycolatopsis aidingensis]
MIQRRVDLPVDVLAALTTRENLGPLHLTLQPEPRWLPDEEQHAAQARLEDTLIEAGLLHRDGRVDAGLLDALTLLTGAAVEYYGWFTHEGSTWGVLAACRGLAGLLAVRADDQVALAPVHHEALAEALVEQLPEAVPGGGSPWTVGMPEFHEAAERGSADRARSQGVREIVKVVQRPVLGSGELYVAERDDLGRYLRLEQPLHYVDTDWGRYLNYTTGSGDEAEIHVAPGSPAALASTLRALRGRLVRP